jgi:hypothetical protein
MVISPRTLLVSLLLSLTVVGTASATSYFVTQSGAGSHSGLDLANAWSVANYNASNSPTGEDTVFFSGNITSQVTPATNGKGNGSGRLTLDFTGATLNIGTSPNILIGNRSYLTFEGGTASGPGGGDLFGCNHTVCHDITIDGWTLSGPSGQIVGLISAYYCSFCTFTNNHVTNGVWGYGDSTLVHDILISGNYIATGANTVEQTDTIAMGDAYNVTIEKNMLINQSPGQNDNGQHNDVIQTFHSGAGGAGNPSGWIVRYNYIWLNQNTSFRTGDNSWMQLESFDDAHGGFGIKIYGNVFVGDGSTFSGNNGFGVDSHGNSYHGYVINNTIIRKNGPDRTIGWVSGGNLCMRNNVFQADTGEGGTDIDVAAMTPGCGGYDYNYWYHLDGKVTSGTTGAHGSSTADPQFTSYSGGDYSLGAGSPLVSAGDSTVGSEFNQGACPGATWPNPTLCTRSAGAWDVGAYQSGSGDPPPDPPTRLNAQVN